MHLGPPARACTALSLLTLLACSGEEGAERAQPQSVGQVPALVAAVPARSRTWAFSELPALLGAVLPEPDAAGRAERQRRSAEGDDWETEKLHDRALPALRSLLEVLLAEGGPAPEALDGLLADPFEGTGALRPQTLSTVFDDGSTRVLAPAGGEREHGAVELLRESAARLRAALGAPPAPAVWPRVVSLDLSGETAFQTRVLLQFDGRDGSGPVQVNAVWLVAWSWRGEDPPRVRSIDVESYQEVRAERELFAEVTEAVFGAEPWWRSEFLHGVDDWHMRLDRVAGVDFQGMQGIAVGDVTGDGLEDVYVCQQVGLPNRLFVRNPDGTASDRAALAKVDYLEGTASALIVDLDGDGARDLALGVGNQLVVALNDGGGVFSRQRAFPAQGVESFFSLSAADADGDGDLDLYGCRYAAGGVMTGAPSPYHDADNGATNYYWRNDGPAGFSDATAEAGFAANNRKFSTTSLWEDVDDDGDLDLYVINDFGRNNLWRNDGRGHFVDAAGELGLEDIAAGMGISAADYDLDGDLDFYLSNMFAEAGLRTTAQERFLGGRQPALRPVYRKHARGNTLLARQADGTYADVSETAGISPCGWSWGGTFSDFDLDGYADLYVPNGMTTARRQPFDLESYFWRRVVSNSPVDPSTVELYRMTFDFINDMTMFGGDSWNGHERNNAFLNLGNGRFAEVSHVSGAGFVEDSRCVATLDWDDDGREDLLVKSRTAPRLRLLLDRDASPNHFVRIELAGRAPNIDAIGARVVATVGGRPRPLTVYAGEGYLCQGSPRLVFGLGPAERVDALEVRWPDGTRSSHGPLAADRRWRIEQGAPGAREIPARSAPALAGLASVHAEHDPAPVDRVVLASRLPMAPFVLPAFEGEARRVDSFKGRPLLLHVWSAAHESGPAALADLAAAMPALAALDVAVVCLSVDEGLGLARARKALLQTPFAAHAGYLDGAAREAVRLAVLEILGFFDGVPLPTTLLLDTAGQACVLYLGPPDPRQVAADAAVVRELNPAMRGTLRLSGGRWLRQPRRDLTLLARALETAGFEEIATFYRSLGAAAPTAEGEGLGGNER